MAPQVRESPLRDRLYEAYASQHAGRDNKRAAAVIYKRDIRPMLPNPPVGPIVDIGCGQGELVRLLLEDGYDAEGIDISPEQVSLAQAAGLKQVRHGDYREVLHAGGGQVAAVTATDVLEHLTKEEALKALDCILAALTPGGVFVARVPNAVSPLGGYVRYGDFTHESSYTTHSIRQLAAAAGFDEVTIRACPPVPHGVVSAIRASIWKLFSGFYKVALVAETGTLTGHIVTQNLTFSARKAQL